jgi:hypothetical protein
MTKMILAVLIVVGVALSMGAGLSMVLSTAFAHYQESGSQTAATDQIGTTPANRPAREKPPAGKPKAQKAMSYAPLHAKGLVSVSSQSIH